MNIIVHVHSGIKQHGYELGTRQAWRCGSMALEVTRVIGVVKGQIVCVIDGVSAALSTVKNNPVHEEKYDGRYIFLGGKCWTELNIGSEGLPELMFKKISGLSQGHRYMSDKDLFANME